MPQGPSVWLGALIGALVAGFGRVIAFLPNLLGAALILLAGWGLGKLLQAIVNKGMRALHFNELTERAGINDTLKRADIKFVPSAILGIIVYWLVFLSAIYAAVAALGITALDGFMTTVLLYLPRIFAALLLVIVGTWAANVLARITRASANAAGIGYASTLSTVVQYTVIFFTFVNALEVLGLAFPFMRMAFAIVLGAFALAAAIAFGLGGREYAADLLAGRELRMLFHPGDPLVSDDLAGTVKVMRPTLTVARTAKGDVAVQNSELMHKHATYPQRASGEGDGAARAA